MIHIPNITTLAPERRAEILAEKVRHVAAQRVQIQGMLKKIHGQRRRERGISLMPENRAPTSWEAARPAITTAE